MNEADPGNLKEMVGSKMIAQTGHCHPMRIYSQAVNSDLFCFWHKEHRLVDLFDNIYKKAGEGSLRD